MNPRKSLWRGVAIFAATSALLATSMAGAFSAPGGTPGPPPGGGGGGGHQPGDETTNNLSVPAVFVENVGVGTPTCDGAPRPAAGDTSTFPTDFVLPLAGVTPGQYYVQGEDTWQASCTTAGANTLTAGAAWGDNLAGGSASLKVGSPVRVEVGLTTTTLPAGFSPTGFDTIKLTDELDRLATYGTLGVAEAPYDEVRVWSSDAQFGITGPVNTALGPMSAEINATGRVVYGYNWRPSTAGEYTLRFVAPSVSVDTSITVTVAGSAGGGGGRGGGGPR